MKLLLSIILLVCIVRSEDLGVTKVYAEADCTGDALTETYADFEQTGETTAADCNTECVDGE